MKLHLSKFDGDVRFNCRVVFVLKTLRRLSLSRGSVGGFSGASGCGVAGAEGVPAARFAVSRISKAAARSACHADGEIGDLSPGNLL
jgi:hypothetical protein